MSLEPPEPGRWNWADRTGAAKAASKMLNFFHTKFDHKVFSPLPIANAPKFGGILSQKFWDLFLCFVTKI
jgi:hypothetical protein